MASWVFVPAFEQRVSNLPDGSTKLERRRIAKARHAIVRFRVESGRPIVE